MLQADENAVRRIWYYLVAGTLSQSSLMLILFFRLGSKALMLVGDPFSTLVELVSTWGVV